MAELLIDEQGFPSAPAAGKMLLYPDSGASSFIQRNDAGRFQGDDYRAAIAQLAAFSADTYIPNSGLILPSHSMQVGMFWEWRAIFTKGAGGTATPVYTVRIGPNQTVGDTSRLAITGSAQTAAADTCIVKILVTCRSLGVAGVLQGSAWLQHNLAATGFASTPAGFNLVQGTSAGFDNTALGGQYIGLSVNPGASGAWVMEQCVGFVYY